MNSEFSVFKRKESDNFYCVFFSTIIVYLKKCEYVRFGRDKKSQFKICIPNLKYPQILS